MVPAVVPAAAGGGAAPPTPGAGAGRRPGLGRRGLAWLGHPDAAAGRAGGGRRAAGALLHAAAVHAVPQPAPQRPLPDPHGFTTPNNLAVPAQLSTT